MDDLIRLKAVLAEKKKTSKWLAEELGVSITTVSRWCTNSSKPDLDVLVQIAKLLGVGLNDLVRFEEDNVTQQK
ncbi:MULTISPECIES: helix-turn-helix transcriptional regulator [Bacteroidales]|uniref:helix-turn-helix transcriptional regulator n=1 Tax=Bacteroidales TaxID=171549 RepID=UPI001C3CEE68|nr:MULTISPECIES: helix-turn-helix transcriptional regulator [Bacteroidales]